MHVPAVEGVVDPGAQIEGKSLEEWVEMAPYDQPDVVLSVPWDDFDGDAEIEGFVVVDVDTIDTLRSDCEDWEAADQQKEEQGIHG